MTRWPTEFVHDDCVVEADGPDFRVTVADGVADRDDL